MTAPRIILIDDGTLDTVLQCIDCRQEFRYTYDPGPDVADGSVDDYDAWIDTVINELADDHVCGEEE